MFLQLCVHFLSHSTRTITVRRHALHTVGQQRSQRLLGNYPENADGIQPRGLPSE